MRDPYARRVHIPLKKRIALNLHDRYRKNEARLHRLNYIMWECTRRCNLNCRHCGSDCQQDAATPDMPAGDFLKAIDQVLPSIQPETTTIVFTGGEPLLRNDLEQVGLELYNRRFPWGLVTNGMLLDEKRLESLLKAGLRTITVSLDGLQKNHNWLRGHGNSFKTASHAVKLLARTEGIKFDVVICVNRRSLEEIQELRDWLIAQGVKKWRLFSIFPSGRAADDPNLSLSGKEFREMMEFIQSTRKEGLIDVKYGCEGFLGDFEGEVRDHFFFCRAGINIASIMVDGTITGCTSIQDKFPQGNIYQDNFADVWENRFEKMRDRSWTKTGICAECDFYRHCEGNGTHLWDEKENEPAFCHLHKLYGSEEEK